MDYIGNKFWGDSDRASRIYLSRKMEPFGLGGSKFIFFVSICRHPGITQAGVVKVTLFDKTVVTRAVAAIEEQGLIRREPDPEDRRVFRLYATEEGERIYQQVSEIVRDWNRKIYARLSRPGEEVEALLKEIARANRQILYEELQMDVVDDISCW
ncbi:MAG: MarR family winged helix-turn-helix transcriptional regulator [Oscillospiraceae bacterium]